MMYGEEIHESIGGSTNLNAAAATAALTKHCYLPGSVLYWGVRIATVFSLTGANLANGLLTLYRYTKTIISATVNNAGTGYAVGDLISVVQAGASGGIVRVLTAAAGLVLTVEVVNKGINYIAGAATTVKLNGGGDDALTLVIIDRKSLDTMALVDAQIAGKHYMRRVPNAIADGSPSGAPPCAYNAGEDLVIYVTTMANGDTTETGAYYGVILYQNRGENLAAQPLWVKTAVGTVVSPAVPAY
jgi:hypothetical protein